MSFKFNFFESTPGKENTDKSNVDKENTDKSNVDKETTDKSNVDAVDENTDKSNVDAVDEKHGPVEEVHYDAVSTNLLFLQWTELSVEEEALFYVKDVALTSNMKSITSSSDLVPNIYEGGFEVWECTLDLLKYFASTSDAFSSCTSVLDLGCGSGLLGIYAKIKCVPSSTIHFQDFNREVLANFTVKNYHRNCKDIVPHKTCFLSGDWDAVSKSLQRYDIILSAETIYNIESQGKVLRILQKHLSSLGVAYIAAKRHYFGVGGGVLDFQELVMASGSMKCDVVWTSGVTGLGRDILKVTNILS